MWLEPPFGISGSCDFHAPKIKPKSRRETGSLAAARLDELKSGGRRAVKPQALQAAGKTYTQVLRVVKVAPGQVSIMS